MSNIKLPSEQPSSSKSSSRGVSISNKKTGESASTLAAVMLNENSSTSAAEEEKEVTTVTGTSSSYSSPPQLPPPQHQQQHQQQEPSVHISLRDITEMLDPFFGTSTTLPSLSQQQQRGGPHHERITDVAAEGLTKHVGTEEEATCPTVEHPRGLTSGDEKSGEADDIQGMEEFMEAPGNSWMEAVWEMELERRIVP